MKFQKLYLSQFVALALVSSAYANAAESNKSTDTLNEVVVRAIVPTNVAMLDRNSLKKSSAQNIKDLAQYETGVEVITHTQQLGHTDVTIRGVGTRNRVLMTIDDMPVPDTQADLGPGGNPQYVSGRDLVEIDTVNSVEIFKGGNGTSQGDGAVAGSVNMRTYSPYDFVSDKKPLYFGVKYGFRSLYSSHGTTATLAGKAGLASGLVMLTKRNSHEYKNHSDAQDVSGANRTATNRQKAKQDNLLVKLHLGEKTHILETTFEQFAKKVSTQRQDQETLNAGAMSGIVKSFVADDDYDRQRFSVAYRYLPTDSVFTEAAVKYYHQKLTLDGEVKTDYTNLFFNEKNDYKQSHNGVSVDLKSQFDTSAVQHAVLFGTDYRNIKTGRYINRENLIKATNRTDSADRRYFPPNKRVVMSAYLQDNLTFNNGVILALGLRYELGKTKYSPDSAYLRFVNRKDPVLVNNKADKALLPSIGLTLPMTDNLTSSLAYRRGYRMPDVNFVGAAFENPNGGYRIIPNAELKSETSDNFELGFNYQRKNVKVNFTTFYSKYKNFISIVQNPVPNRNLLTAARPGQPPRPFIEFYYDNLNKVKTYGGELSVQYRVAQAVKLSANIAYMRGKDEKGEALSTAYPLNGMFGIDYEQAKWGVGTKVRWAAKKSKVPAPYTTTDRLTRQTVQNEYFKTPGYAVWDMSAYYKPIKNLELSASVYNLFNKKYWDSSTVALLNNRLVDQNSAPGRNFALNAELKF